MNDDLEPLDTEPRTLTEDEKVAGWRLDDLVRAGYPIDIAERIALSGANLREAVKLVESGCPPRLAAEILL